VPVPAPTSAELSRLVQRVAERIGRSLERSGLITRDIENAYLAFDPGEEAPINALLGASITYRIATGPHGGQKVFTLQTLPVEPEAPRREVAESSGFSPHAGIAAKAKSVYNFLHKSRLDDVIPSAGRRPVGHGPLSRRVHTLLPKPGVPSQRASTRRVAGLALHRSRRDRGIAGRRSMQPATR